MPEIVHPDKPVEHFGPEASNQNNELVAGKELLLYKDVSETDKYGRLLRYIVADGRFVNYELVREGYANRIQFYDNEKYPDLNSILGE